MQESVNHQEKNTNEALKNRHLAVFFFYNECILF